MPQGSKLHYNERWKSVSNQRIISENEAGIGITVNGERRSVPAGLNVREVLSRLGVAADRVAVEMNREIVRKAEWETTVVPDGASLEIVEFVGGG
jgi:thiamine biosynthesis protein ThiS